jgi:hypothetical protein
MNEQYATKMFYEWEQEKYGDNSPLSDQDRIVWVQGYLRGLEVLFNHLAKGSV